jgi:hypothetical protein
LPQRLGSAIFHEAVLMFNRLHLLLRRVKRRTMDDQGLAVLDPGLEAVVTIAKWRTR